MKWFAAALVVAALAGCAHEVVPDEEWVVTYVSGRTEHLRRDSWYGMWFDDNGNRVFLSHVETTRRIK